MNIIELRTKHTKSVAGPNVQYGWAPWWNRSGRPGDRWTNICWMVPEKRTDVISEVLR